MSIFHNTALAGASGAAGGGAGGYQIQRSLRFNSSDSAYLSRTPSTAGNRKTWTWAGWIKRCKTGQAFRLLGQDSYPNYSFLQFTSGDKISFITVTSSGSVVYMRQSIAVYRDVSAWYHITFVHDTTEATTSNRYRFYVNGVLVDTELGEGSYNYPPQNTDGYINTTLLHHVNYFPAVGGSSPGDGYLADVHFIDGQALTPSSFTEVSATTGQLVPKAYSGSFGTNGFWLKFSDNSAATATTLGKDYSGNSNNWTPNNLSVTAGAGNDSLVDTPTSYGTDTGAGGEVRGNYATLNAIASGLDCALANGNLDYTYGVNGTRTGTPASFGMNSGKWYWEIVCTSKSGALLGAFNGISSTQENSSVTSGIGYYPGYTANGWGYFAYNGDIRNNLSNIMSVSAYTVNDVIGFAFDADSGKLWVSKNGVWQNSGNPAAGTGAVVSSLPTGTYYPCVGDGDGGDSHSASVNFGQRPFAYTAPSGFKALCDTNLPAPTIALPSTVMDVLLYTGNGASSRSVTGLAFSPEFVWIKKRSAAAGHGLFDVVRGAANALHSNNTGTEAANSVYGKLSSFDSTGFTVADGTDPSDPRDVVNVNGATYVAWAWDAGSSTVTNTQGSITSQVRANASAGFSIVTYTGNGSNATIGHGLGVAPSLYIVKARTSSGYTDFWSVYHKSLGATAYIKLNSTDAQTTGSTIWNSTAPTSTVFSVDSGSIANVSSVNYVAYCFAPVAGYSSFGSYTGNGSSTNFIHLGFRPKFWIHKRTDSAGSWMMLDASRSPYNVVDQQLYANLSNAESTYTGGAVDFLSNGVALRTGNSDVNGSGIPYIYIAFAESPFQYARAR